MISKATIKGFLKTFKYKLNGSIAITYPCPQENQNQNVCPLLSHPHLISLTNQSITVTLNNPLRQKFKVVRLQGGALKAHLNNNTKLKYFVVYFSHKYVKCLHSIEVSLRARKMRERRNTLSIVSNGGQLGQFQSIGI